MYIDISFEPSNPIASTGEDNVGCIIGRTSTYSGETIFEISSINDLEAYGLTEQNGGVLYKAINGYFKGNAVMPRDSKLLVVVYEDSNSEIIKEPMIGTIDGSNKEFRTRSSPVSDLSVFARWETGGDYIEQVSYSAKTIATGSTLLSGEIEFTGKLKVDDTTEIDMSDVPASFPDARIFADYKVSGLGNVLRNIRDKNITSFALAYDETESAMATGYYSESWLMDQLICYNEVVLASSDKPRMYYFSTPRGIKASDTIPASLRGGIQSVTYEDLAKMMQSEFVACITHENVVSNGIPIDNVAGVYQGMAQGQYPFKKGLTLSSIPISQVTFPSEPEIQKFNNAQIASIISMPDIYPNDKMISYGFTFGSGVSARIEFVRSKIKIFRELKSTIMDFLRSKDHYVDMNGCTALNSTIKALFDRLKTEGVCDGIKSITNPLLDKFRKKDKTASDLEYIQFYVDRNWIPDVVIEYIWRGNPEYINITVRRVAI